MKYLEMVDLIDTYVDYIGLENPPSTMHRARAKVSFATVFIERTFGINAYNDIVSEFHLDRHGWILKEEEI